MKGILTVIITAWVLLSSCEDEIHPVLPQAGQVMVVDAWLTDKPATQVIRLRKTLPYFDASPLPGVAGADVRVTGDDGSVYHFAESDTAMGDYLWQPDSIQPVFGATGIDYHLMVTAGEDTYTASGRMGSVPEIDSINFKFNKGNSFMDDSYTAQFYATDLPGYGNTYWIKAYKNGNFLGKPSEINVAFDAGFSQGSIVDGIQFIQPIREGINPFEQDDNGKILPAYLPGDSVYVELNSVSYAAFNFLTQVSIQTNRPGGFSELFAQPLSNVPTNIASSNPDKPAIGFFNVAAVTGLGKKLTEEK